MLILDGGHNKPSNPKPEYPKSESNPNGQNPKEEISIMSMSAPAPLNYEKRAPWHRRKKYHRIALGILTFSVAMPLWQWRAPIQRRVELLYWQRQCLNYTAPKDQIIGMMDEFKTMDALIKTDKTYNAGEYLGSPYVLSTSPIWDQYRSLIDGPTHFGLVGGAPTLTTAIPAIAPTPIGPTIAFMHERTSPGGEKRLVVVVLSREFVRWEFDVSVYRISNFPEDMSGSFAGGLDLWIRYMEHPGDSTAKEVGAGRFFAGQVDVADPSRFTIRYELDGLRGTIEGELLDHEKVRLVVRDGPGCLPGRSQQMEKRP